MSTTWHRGFAAALLLAGLISGCSKSDQNVIAEVGDHDITIAEFDELSPNQASTHASAQEEFDFKSQLLDSIIVQRLLIQAAYDKGLDQSDEVTQAVAANKDKFLLDALYEKNVNSKVSVTDSEIRDLYDKLEFRRRVAHILVKDADTAKALVARLVEGASFEQLAHDYSIDPSAKRNRGDLGFIQYGSMSNVPEFEEAVFALKVGEVSPPVQTRYGYHIIKVTETSPNDSRGEFEPVKEELRRRADNIERTKLAVDYIASIQEKYPMAVDQSTLDYLVHKREELYPPDLLKSLPKNDFDDAQLDRNERELVVATWAGGQVTVAKFLEIMRSLPPASRPSFEAHDSIPGALFQGLLTDILTYEASQQGLDSDEEYKRKVLLFKELTMAEAMRQDSSLNTKPPTEEELRQYYDAHTEEFTEPARVRIFEIQVSDELVANNLAKEIRSMEEFRQKASQLTERSNARNSGGDLSYITREYYPELFDVAYRTQVGGIGGPVRFEGKYSVVYVHDKIEASVRDFLTARSQVSSTLHRKAEAEIFRQWVEARKADTKIEVYTDVLWSTIDKAKYAAVDSAAGGTAISGN